VISKPMTSLTKIKGEIPSPLGHISLEWNLNSTKTLKISIPKGMEATIDVNSFKSKEIILNGEKITQTNFIQLKEGAYTISF